MSRTTTKVCIVVAVSCAVACTGILGDFEVAPPTIGLADTGPGPSSFDASQTNDAGQTDASSDAGGPPAHACETASDCNSVTMVPDKCAIAACEQNKCVYTAIDGDQDGHRLAGCSVDGAPLAGTDCADDTPSVFPGGSCTKRPDGSDIVFPNGTPLGECKAGHWECASGKATCVGAVEPKGKDECSNGGNDANCNGVKAEGCDCSPGATESCGNAEGKPLPCKAGTRTCGNDGKWGTCVGNIEPKPRDCASTVDNDCSGQADRTEVACQCPGGVAQGQPKPDGCNVPGTHGECQKGGSTCIPEGSIGVFSECKGPDPGSPKCESTEVDNDCNGIRDYVQVQCGSPCLDPKGSGKAVAAMQRWGNFWGCPGRRSYSAASAGCAAGSSICTAESWIKLVDKDPKAIQVNYKYWVSEKLAVVGQSPANGGTGCSVFVPEGKLPPGAEVCLGGNSSMAVCPNDEEKGGEVIDRDRNVCLRSLCGYKTTKSHAFGGCDKDDTGGTLCCGTVPIPF